MSKKKAKEFKNAPIPAGYHCPNCGAMRKQSERDLDKGTNMVTATVLYECKSKLVINLSNGFNWWDFKC